MKKIIKSGSENYACSVVLIDKLYEIPGADRIQRCVVNGNDVVVGKDVNLGDEMLYFCSGTKLNEDYCKYNDLLTDPDMNRNKTKGYISHKQFRVKAIKLKGIISDGMLMPLSSLAFAISGGPGSSKKSAGATYSLETLSLSVGDEFTDLGDVSVCEKYFVPVRNSGKGKEYGQRAVKISRLVESQFHLHEDTNNLRKNAHKIKPKDVIGLHYKKHGTSVVIGNVLVKRVLKWYEKLASKLGIKVNDTEYDIIYSSRKVVKNGYLNTNPNSFYKTDVWGEVAKEVGPIIPKNYTLYGEICGYESSGSAIQKCKFGAFDYGCEVGQHVFYVYRITVVNPDGIVNELSDLQIREFCNKYGLKYDDTFIYYGEAQDLFDISSFSDDEWSEKFVKRLEERYNEKDCYMCKSGKLPEEGIIIRKETLYGYEAYKLKSRRFILMESDQQEEAQTNIEDNQDLDTMS